MNISTLQISDDIRNEFSIDANGQIKVSQRGAARLLGITDKLMRPPLAVTLTQDLANAGLEGASFDDGITDVAFAILATYVAFDSPSANLQAVAVVKTLTAIGARRLFHSIAGVSSKPELKLPSAIERDRITNLASAVSSAPDKPLNEIETPLHKTIRGFLVELGEDPYDDDSLLHDRRFCCNLARTISYIHRANHGKNPSRLKRKHGGSFIYPPYIKGFIAHFRQEWLDLA